MTEVVQNWLGTRLGIVLDMSPQNFGRNTKDGKLMAKLLHHYGVIPEHVLEKIVESRNFYECYNNWVILQSWLKHIGATNDSEILERIAGGEGSAAISLFYSVYLNLELNERLHYISAQKERRFSEIKWGEKFKVDVVPEVAVRETPEYVDDKLSKPLTEKNDLVEWHREKCKEVIENINKTKKKFSEMMKKNHLIQTVPKIVIPPPVCQQQREAEETKNTITAFEKKHPDKGQNLPYSELIKQQHEMETKPCIPVPNLDMAKKMMSDLKRRKKIEIYSRNYVQKMQLMILDEEWKQIVENQFQNFEEIVCKNLLKQSQYEKQMTNKLYQLRQQKKILAENRSIIENLKMDQEDKEYNDKLALKMEYRGECWDEEEFHREKNLELHKRIYADKVNAKKEFLKQECREIIQSIMDVAIKIADIREQVNCDIPKAIMKDLKELFFKNLPIFDSLANLEELYERDEHLSEDGDEQETSFSGDNYKLIKDRENYRQSMLDDCDFFDYQNFTGPWAIDLLFPDNDEPEVQQIVLAYIVNKILEIKYPIPKLPLPAPIKTKKRACVVLDLEDEACKMLTDLMNLCKILVVHVEDAINFVLSAYKEETSTTTLISDTLKNFSRDTLRKKESRREVHRKLLLLKKESQIREDSVENEGFTADKETQTPKKIPQGDSPLSSNAEIGRAAFEAFYFGDPVPDPTIICALVAYITAKQKDYDGWIILNYPRLYSQASDLEFALNGYRVLPEPKTSESIEEMEGFTYRHRVVNPFCLDDHIKNRTSKLVPNISTLSLKKEVPLLPESPTTYFNIFLRLKKLESHIRLEPDGINFLSSMERFYQEQKVFRIFEYSTQNFQTVKNIGKILLGYYSDIGEKTSKTSLEIFGNEIMELNEKWNKTKARTSLIPERKGQKTTRPSDLDKADNYSTAFTENLESFLDSKDISQTEEKEVTEYNFNVKQEEKKENLKPGDPDWNWAEGFQPKELLLALATLWENMESVYIETLKDVFFSLRVHRLNVLSYCKFVKKTRRALMRRKDEKQTVLEEFQKKFNAIEEDIRVDVDVKTELYVRVAEMEEILMGMADERRKNSFNDIKEIANDSWVPNEMSSLVNSFLTAVQLEVDRCTNTCQVINDYYMSILQKVPDERSVDKIIVPKLLSRDKMYSYVSSSSAFSKKSLKQPVSSRYIEENSQTKSKIETDSRKNSEKTNKSRSLADKKHKTSDTNFLNGAAESIAEILTNLSFPSGSTTPFHEFLKENVATVIHEIQNIMHNYIADARKGDKPNMKSNRKRSRIKTSVNNVNLEWVTALENELARFLLRVKLLLVKGIFDMNEFLIIILNTFASLNEEVNEMYCKEIQSISDCCKVFRCSIEEEIPIQYQLTLKEDEFYINTDVLLYDKRPDYLSSIKKEEQTKTFTVDQLSLLFDKLQKVAPDGEIIKRSLLFILEDLRAMHYEMKCCNCFPDSWKLIEPEDMTWILNEIYQDLEIVCWKDFIIYALDLPIPSEQDILTIRNAYRTYDSLTTELINWENFSKVCFWFESSFYYSGQVKILEKVKELLFKMYQVDENRSNYSALLLAFCKDENPIYGFTKALALATGKEITVNEIISENSSLAEEYEIYEEEAFQESTKTTPKKRICCLSPSVEKTLKCLPKEKILRCDCGDIRQQSLKPQDEEEEKISENVGEHESDFYQDSLGYPYGALNVSVVPCDIVSSIIRASFPSLPQLSVLLDCPETFQETLNSIYDSLESKNGKIDIFDLIRHNFVSRLLLTTNKFKFIKIQELFNSSFNAKNSIIQPSIGPSKLNYHSFA